MTTNITDTTIRELARTAVTRYRNDGVPLTEGVIGALRDVPELPLTAEHARRVCEETYRQTFEVEHLRASGSERYISFAPAEPDQVVTQLFGASKEASMAPNIQLAHDRARSQPLFRERSPISEWSKLASVEEQAPAHDPVQVQRAVVRDLSDRYDTAYGRVGVLGPQFEREALKLASSGATILQIKIAAEGDGVYRHELAHVLSHVRDDLAHRGYAFGDKVAGVLDLEHPFPKLASELGAAIRDLTVTEHALEAARADLARMVRAR
ncbi:hypothetical protein EBT31_04325 [bacterium]|nr:hypothetical protein [bacterium]